MAAKLGNLNQNAFVVPDIQAAVEYWTQVVGVGPFLLMDRLEFSGGTLHGKPQIPSFKAAMAYSGELLIELIEPSGPSIFQEFLDGGGSGVHHNCIMVDDHDAAVADLAARGASVEQFQTLANGARISYVQLPEPLGPLLEIAQLPPEVHGLFDLLKQAGANWDGKTAYLDLAG